MKTSLPRPARIAGVTDESAQVRTYTLDLSMEAEPGQFVMAWVPGVDEKPFSLVHAEPVILMIARVGPFTTVVQNLAAGERLWLRGPLGRGFALPKPKDEDRTGNLLLVAGGYGAAPLHFLAERALAAGWTVSVVLGARTAAEVILADRFTRMGARVEVTTDDGSRGERGLATEAAARLLDAEYDAVYACGPEQMLVATEALARSRKVPVQLSYERYMRCGFGVCGSCTRQGWLACRDGPVLKIEP